MITIYASNSSTSNDYWSQRPFDSFVLYFTLKDGSSNSGSNGGTENNAMVSNLSNNRKAIISRAYEWYNTIWTTKQDITAWHGSKVSANTRIRGIPYSCANGKVYYAIDDSSISNSYFDLSDDQIYITGYGTQYGADCVQFVWDCIYTGCNEIGFRGSLSSKGTYIGWEDVLPGDLFLRDNYPNKSDHVMLIVDVDYNGTSECYDDIYTIIDCTSDAIGINYDGVLSLGIRKNTYTYNSMKNGGASIYGGDYVGIGYKPFRIDLLAYESSSITTYTITYDGNDWEDGNCEPITVEKKYGEDLIVADVYTTNGNKEFLGWALYPDLNTPIYQPGDIFTENKDECFYAVWGDSDNEDCSHNWGEWQNKGSYSIRYCSLCDISEVATNYEGKIEVSDSECTHNWSEWQDKGSYSIRYCSLCEISETKNNYAGGTVVTKYTISGTITSYGNTDDNVTLTIYDSDGNKVDIVTLSDSSYSVTLAEGDYVLSFSKENHVTREYEVSVNSENITQDAQICLIGDVNLDGEVTAEDAAAIMKHLARMNIIEDQNALQNAEVTGDNEVTAEDAAKIMKYLARMIDSLG